MVGVMASDDGDACGSSPYPTLPSGIVDREFDVSWCKEDLRACAAFAVNPGVEGFKDRL